MPVSGLYPLPYPLAADNALDVPLHPLGAVPLHLFGHMTVYIEGKSGGGVSQVALDRLDTVSILQRQHRKSVTQVMHSGLGLSDLNSQLF